MASSVIHKVTVLPQCHADATTWARVVELQKALRLQSLRISPEAFGSTYERETTFTDADWEQRLQNPLAFTLIAHESLTNAPSGHDVDFVEANWVGSLVLTGPLDQLPVNVYKSIFARDEEYRTLEEMAALKVAEFVLSGLFVMPGARGKGLGKALVDAAIGHAEELAKQKGAKQVVMKIVTALDSPRVVGLYEAWGFVRTVQFKGGKGGDLVELEKMVNLDEESNVDRRGKLEK